MKQALHILALLLFALTQFVAPFAHAHVDGIHGDKAIHTGDIPRHLHLQDQLQCNLESYESQAIGPQQEYQRDNAATIPANPVAVVQPTSSSATPYLANYCAPVYFVALAYHRPHPQAPPA